MPIIPAKTALIKKLQKDILAMQHGQHQPAHRVKTGLGTIEKSFPQQRFPTGGLHELISYSPADAAATNGFLAGLLSHILPPQGFTLWISTWRRLFPPALASFGIDPARVIFIDIPRNKEALWAFEEALKCSALQAVVGEMPGISFTESRRLQLAIEESHVTAFLHRHQPRSENTIACIARWMISAAPSLPIDGLPGIGFPAWNVKLLRVRNGRPGTWQLAWNMGQFQHLAAPAARPEILIRKAV